MNYNSPFIKLLETIANMIIVSMLWLIFCLPVVTIVPSSCALYHTTAKIIFGPGKGNGVFKDFFNSYKDNIIPGIKLTLILLVARFFIFEGLWTGWQFYKVSILGMLYFGLGIIITAAVTTAVIYIPPVLSRFDAPILSIIRIAVYFVMKHPLRSIFNVALLALLAFMVEMFPLALLIVPGLYSDLIRIPLEKDMKRFMEENGLREANETETVEKEETAEETESVYDMNRKFSRERKSGKK